MRLGKKEIKNVRYFFMFTILLLLGYLMCKAFTKREGVVFTKFDNRTFFTKPWDNFCIPTSPSCQKPFLEKPGMIGVFPVGCNCESVGLAKSPPGLPESCYETDHSYYYK